MTRKTRYELEFQINSSPKLLFQYISTTSGLSEWFADNVISKDGYFVFVWDNMEEKAKLASKKIDERMKFKWIDDYDNDSGYYFEMRITIDELTKDVSLVIVDFAEEEDMEAARLLWTNQVSKLKNIMGIVA